MPTWGEILQIFVQTAQQNPLQSGAILDAMRRNYLQQYTQHTNRRVFLYASCWLQKPSANRYTMSINDEDMQGFMEIMHGVQGTSLDPLGQKNR
jgi:hypothetical protein